MPPKSCKAFTAFCFTLYFLLPRINEEYKGYNSNTTTVISGDSVSVTIKNTIPYSKKNYKQIDKWKLTVKLKNVG